MTQWWEVGKTQIKVFCQNFSYNTTVCVKKKIEELEKEIIGMENVMDVNVLGVSNDLRNKKLELRSILEERAKGALIRARISSIKDMDSPTSYFFNLERKVAQQKCVLHLRKENGTLTSNPTEMRKMAMDFYADLYGNTDCDSENMAKLLQGLPKLQPGDKKKLDTMINLNELSEAVQQLSTGRAPGIDGLPAEFYKTFWAVLVCCECFETGMLPISCQRAVISLLPKNGDLGFLTIKYWQKF